MAIARELLECGCRPKLSPGNLRVTKSLESVLDRYPREGVVNRSRRNGPEVPTMPEMYCLTDGCKGCYAVELAASEADTYERTRIEPDG